MQDQDLESKLKDKLLEGLIDHMEDKMGDDMSSKFPMDKGLSVSVAAPDKEHLADALDKAKDLTASVPDSIGGSADEGSDEDRLMQLMGDDDEDDKWG